MRLIDADALEKTLDDVCVGICNCCSAFDPEKWRCSLIDHAPTIDAAPVVHAQWDGEGDGYADGELVFDVWHCSECGYCIDDGTDDPVYLPRYCPQCGARMDGDSA